MSQFKCSRSNSLNSSHSNLPLLINYYFARNTQSNFFPFHHCHQNIYIMNCHSNLKVHGLLARSPCTAQISPRFLLNGFFQAIISLLLFSHTTCVALHKLQFPGKCSVPSPMHTGTFAIFQAI